MKKSMERILWKICNYFNHRFSLAALDESIGKWPVAPSPKNRGFTRMEIYHCILQERQDWSNHADERKKVQYLTRTLLKAEEIIG